MSVRDPSTPSARLFRFVVLPFPRHSRTKLYLPQLTLLSLMCQPHTIVGYACGEVSMLTAFCRALRCLGILSSLSLSLRQCQYLVQVGNPILEKTALLYNIRGEAALRLEGQLLANGKPTNTIGLDLLQNMKIQLPFL